MRDPGPTQPRGAHDGVGYQLVVFGDNTFLTRPLPAAGALSIGRLPECDVSVDHPLLSRKHALLYIEQGSRFFIEDQGAINGVMINGRRLEPYCSTALAPGVAVELGGITLFIQQRPASLSLPMPAQQGPSRAQLLAVTGAMLTAGDPMLSRVASSPLSVLILGETGVGKDVLARHLHKLSPRAERDFLAINCAALPDNLIESELFGHEKGAFSGADRVKQGLLEVADGGTLFLDEIGELPPAAQAKLLRFLESGELLRVGGLRAKTVHVRILAATHQQLSGAGAYRGFRQDLYYRLAVLSLWLPPLRERRDEIIPLAERFIAEAAAQSERPRSPRLDAAAAAVLGTYCWPGNIRELRNVMHRATVLCGDTIEPRHLALEPAAKTVAAGPAAPAFPPPLAPAVVTPAVVTPVAPPAAATGPIKSQLEDLERQRILATLAAHGGNQSRTAAALGMPRRTMIKRLEEYGIARPRKPSKQGSPDVEEG